MVHERPGRWRFVYTINEHGMRGESIPLSNRVDVPNIVVLGDSYSFGSGVNDGEEFPARLMAELEGQYRVVNTGVGGYGLTQQIRRFYEFGRLYAPSLVVLQFCANDPHENLQDEVTQIEDGHFVFQDSDRRFNPYKRWLSESALLQRSQVYAFLRSLYDIWKQRGEVSDPAAPQRQFGANGTDEEQFYNQLLEAFATDLNRRGIPLLMISVTHQLQKFPSIWQKVHELDEADLLDYREVGDWLEPGHSYGSPEGHLWGVEAHDIIARHLAEIIRRDYSPSATAPRDTSSDGLHQPPS